MYTIKARYDGKKFTPMQPIPVREDCEVLITFLEPEKKESAKIPFSEMRGIFKGKIRMSDNFNEPLEELREYME